MDIELGPKKAESWRLSGKLETRPDRVTGGTEPHEIEYKCPEDWSSFVEADNVGVSFYTKAEGDEEQLTLLNGVTAASSSSLSQEAEVMISFLLITYGDYV